MNKGVDDYIQEGLYGTKQINPSERKLYLGSLRERVVLALTKAQVMQKKGLKTLDLAMQQNNGTKLLLNGKISYRFFKPYKKLSSKNKVPYTSVKNRDAQSQFGLILTYDHAIDKEDILLSDSDSNEESNFQDKESSFFSSIFSWFKK